jgi:hypothetical protein
MLLPIIALSDEMDNLSHILTWIEERYRNVPLWWTDAQFHCFEDLPDELRELEMTGWPQVQIKNGGPAQLLYNTFNHWMTHLSRCLRGYRRMSFLEEAAAVVRYQELFSRYSDVCKSYVRRSLPDGTKGDFVGFMEAIEKQMETDDERLFYSWSGLYERKAAYVERHREELLQLMASTPPRSKIYGRQ